MRELTQIIHGQRHVDAVEWANRGFDALPSDALDAAGLVSDGLLLVVNQLTTCVVTLLESQGRDQVANHVWAFRPTIPELAISPLYGALWPTDLRLIQEGEAENVHELAANYDAILPRGKAGWPLLPRRRDHAPLLHSLLSRNLASGPRLVLVVYFRGAAPYPSHGTHRDSSSVRANVGRGGTG